MTHCSTAIWYGQVGAGGMPRNKKMMTKKVTHTGTNA